MSSQLRQAIHRMRGKGLEGSIEGSYGENHGIKQGGDHGMHEVGEPSDSIEHELEKKSDMAPHTQKYIKSATEHEDSVGIRAQTDLPHSKAKLGGGIEHETNAPAGLADDDGDDDASMVHHMTHGMSDHDMEHSLSSKPKSLGERVRRDAVVKATNMKKDGKMGEY